MPIIKYRTLDSHQDYYMIESPEKLVELKTSNQNLYNDEGKIVDVNYQGRKYRVLSIMQDFSGTESKVINIAFFALTIATFGTILFSENSRSFRNQKSYICLLAPENETVKSAVNFVISNGLCEDVEKLIIKKLDSYSIHRLLMTKPNLPKRIEFLWRELFKNPIPHLYNRTLNELRKIYFYKIIQFSQVIDELRVSEQLTELFFERNEWEIIFRICSNIKKITYQSSYFPKELPKNLESLQQINISFKYHEIIWDVDPINISSWPSTLQSLSLEIPITPLSISKLPSLTSLYLLSVNLDFYLTCEIELPPFKLPTTLTALEVNSIDLIQQLPLPHLTKLKMSTLNLSDSKVQFPENLKSLDLRVIFNMSDNYSFPDSLTFLRIRSADVLPNSFSMALPSSLISLNLNIDDLVEVPFEEFLQRPNIIFLAMHSLEPTHFQKLPISLSSLKIFDASMLRDTDISLLPRTLKTLRLDHLTQCTENCIKNLPPSLTKLTLTDLLRSMPEIKTNISKPFALSLHSVTSVMSKFLTSEDLKFLPKSLTSLKISKTTPFALRQWGKKNLSCRWELAKEFL